MVRTKGATAEQTRQRIIDAALELFAERTFAGTAMRDIADALSVTKAAVYYHFDSKDALLDAILRPLAESLDQLVQRTIATRAALEPTDATGDIALKVDHHSPAGRDSVGAPAGDAHDPVRPVRDAGGAGARHLHRLQRAVRPGLRRIG